MSAGKDGAPDQGTLEAWAALAAHQLGEALALVRGAATVLGTSPGALGRDGRDALRAMTAGSDRAQRFVDDLLDVVRAADDPVEPAGDVELELALDAAVEELATALRSSGVALRRAALPPAGLERYEAERLFVHLLRSAIAAGAAEVRIRGAMRNGRVSIEVVDDGAAPGSSPLEPFGAPRGRGPLVGAGVSLVVCRRIAERRGGSVALTPREDGTTMVSVTLPGRPAEGP
jgi:signal transduction histidine kinase